MTFQERLAADVDAVFLDTSRFGETVTLNGSSLAAIVSGGAEYAEGRLEGTLSQRSLTLYLAERDLPEGVDIGREVTLEMRGRDGEPWSVLGLSPQQGVVRLELARRGWR